MNKLIRPNRIRIGNIVIEYLQQSGNKSIILLNGLPSVPEQTSLINDYYNLGYTVFFPRDAGTWESEGEFLAQNPTETINKIIDQITNGIKLKENTYKSNNITIIGSSYGGAVALCIKDREEIKKNITLSPVSDFEDIPNLITLSAFIRDVFPGAYRYSDENWDKLLNGEILSPKTNLKNVDTSKYYIFGGKDDKEILDHKLINLGKQFNISIKLLNTGHLGLSKIEGQLKKDINKILT